MPTDIRTGSVVMLGQREAPVRHHTGPLGADHLTAVVAVGALLWIVGTALVLSWRDSGDRLRGILSEFDEPGAPAAEAESRTADVR